VYRKNIYLCLYAHLVLAACPLWVAAVFIVNTSCGGESFGLESFGLGDPTGMGALSNCFPIVVFDWQSVSMSGFWVWRDRFPSCFGESFGLGDPTGMGALSNCFPIVISDWQPVSTSGFRVWCDNGFWVR